MNKLWGPSGWPRIGVPLGIFALSRLFSTVWLVLGVQEQSTALGDPSMGYFEVITNWDAAWYRSIAEQGYPRTLPELNGAVTQNEWAFLPAYPLLVRLVMGITGLDFAVAGTLVSVACGAAAMVVLYRVVLVTGGPFMAAIAVLAVCIYPTSPILQLPYSESLALLLIVMAMAFLQRRKYLGLFPVVVLLALARQVVLALAIVVSVHLLLRWRARAREPLTPRDGAALGLLVVTCVVLPALWPAIAGAVTGRPDAYLATQSAWPSNQGSLGLLGSVLVISVAEGGLFGLVTLALVLYLLLAFVREPSRELGADLRMWSLVYPLYMLAAIRPNPSVLRYLMLTIGSLPPLPFINSRTQTSPWQRWVVVCLFTVGGLASQYWWVTNFFIIGSDPQPWP